MACGRTSRHRRARALRGRCRRARRRGAYRDSDLARGAGVENRLVQVGFEAFDELFGAERRSGVDFGDDGEFVAAESRHGVFRPQALGEPLGDGDQYFVAGVVAVGVVDRL